MSDTPHKPHKKWDCPCTDCQRWYRDSLAEAQAQIAAWKEDFQQLSDMYEALGRNRERDLATLEAKRREDVRACRGLAVIHSKAASDAICAAFQEDFK